MKNTNKIKSSLALITLLMNFLNSYSQESSLNTVDSVSLVLCNMNIENRTLDYIYVVDVNDNDTIVYNSNVVNVSWKHEYKVIYLFSGKKKPLYFNIVFPDSKYNYGKAILCMEYFKNKKGRKKTNVLIDYGYLKVASFSYILPKSG